jgi:Asp-tRNA(Asn)/Glu-tRNA(Gln) amidotransferase A subunit family amidase
MDDDLFWRPAHELRELFATRQVSPLEFAQAALDRVSRLDAKFHTFITLDHDYVIAQARRAEEALSSSDRLGLLHGVPISIKDNLATAHLRTTFGSLLYRNVVPSTDAIAVARLRAAGAIIFGKTATSEFALQGRTRNRLLPETVNPWSTGLTAGGSSGGAAASVALGMTPIAVGTDAGGSIRLPAAICGVYGVCPSAGRVPRTEVPAEGGYFGPTFQNIGPIARNVIDAEIATRVMSGLHPSDPFALRTPIPDIPTGQTRGLRGLWVTFVGAATNSAVIDCARAAAERLHEIGIAMADDGTALDHYFEPLGILMRARVASYLASLGADPDQRALLTPDVLLWVEQCMSQPISVAQEVAAWRERAELVNRFETIFKGYDFIATPTYSDVAPAIPDGWGWPVSVISWAASTFGVNACGLAAASIPCGFVQGLPVGLQIIVPQGRDDLVFALSREIEQRWPWAAARPYG